MLKLILLLIAASAAYGQTFPAPASAYRHNGWVTGCTKGSVYTSYLEVCEAPNMRPVGTFTPSTGCKWDYSPNTQMPFKVIEHGFMTFTTYTSQSSFNANETYVLVGAAGGNTWIYNLKTCASIRQGPAAPGDVIWSGLNPDKMYYISGNSIRTFSVATGSTALVAAYDGTAGRPNFTRISWGGTGESSKDDWLAITDENYLSDKSGVLQYVCTLNGVTAAGGCVHGPTATGMSGWRVHDFPIPSKGIDSGTSKRYVWIQGGYGTSFSFTDASPTPVLEAVTENPLFAGDHDGIYEAGETVFGSYHVAIGETVDGRQFLMTYELTTSAATPSINVAFFGYGPKMLGVQGQGGGLREIGLGAGYNAVSQLSCAKNSAYCIVTATGNLRTSGTTAANTTAPGARQALLIYNAGERITMVGNLLNEQWTGSGCGSTACVYYQVPLATISPLGRYMSWSTNFGRESTDANINVSMAVADLWRDSKNIRVNSRTTTGFTIRLVAPNVAACTVTISTNADLSSPIVNAAPVTGHAERSYNFTGGATNTLYYYGVTCPGGLGTQTEINSARTL